MLKLNPIQVEAEKLAKDDDVTMLLFRGGAGSGKSVCGCYVIINRALHYPKSRHMILRNTIREVKENVFQDSFKFALNQMFEVSDGSSAWDYFRSQNLISLDPMKVTFPNGSEILFSGLEGDENKKRLTGANLSTAFISEIQHIYDYRDIEAVRDRLRLPAKSKSGKKLVPKLIMDCNPPSKRHWSFLAFATHEHEGGPERVQLDPLTGNPLANPHKWRNILMNGEHNRENLAEGYLEERAEGRKGDYKGYSQFVKGEWFDEVDNPMFYGEDIRNARLPARKPEDCGDLVRISVSIDPATTSHSKSDETGIMVIGSDADGHGYVLADLSGKYQPNEWAKISIAAFHEWKANEIIAERNQGGDMVETVIRNNASTPIPIRTIHASRGKEVRAETTSTAYREGKIHHCGEFPVLESQLLEFEQGFDRKRKGSPDRLDALVHGFNAILFQEIERRSGGSRKVKGMRF